jgi:TRAP-type mannitol/chloroaromatic compound transport system permease small subunit
MSSCSEALSILCYIVDFLLPNVKLPSLIVQQYNIILNIHGNLLSTELVEFFVHVQRGTWHIQAAVATWWAEKDWYISADIFFIAHAYTRWAGQVR